MLFFHHYIAKVLPVVALYSFFLYLPICLFNRKKSGHLPFLRHLSIYTLIGILLSIIYATILLYWPDITFTTDHHLLNLKPFIWISKPYSMGLGRMMEELLLNITMIIPLGIFLPIVFKNLRKCWKTVSCVMILILCIEILQYFTGRSADIDDIIMNAIGSSIGFAIFASLNKYLHLKTWWQKVLDS